LREHAVFNVCSPVITTNHKSNGIYLPSRDRRHYVAWSECKQDDFTEQYWKDMWRYYDDGGFEHVAAYLNALDLSGFNCKAPPRKTAASWAIVDANRAPEDAELADALDNLARREYGDEGEEVLIWPDVVTISRVAGVASESFAEWLKDRKNRRQ